MKIALVAQERNSSIVMDSCSKLSIPKPRVQVIIGVIVNATNEVLMTQRAASLHQGGLWEFPGGKIELNESHEKALQRELFEEIGIDVKKSESLIILEYEYSDKLVCLHVYRVLHYLGTPAICENQLDLKWVALSSWTVDTYPLPVPNLAIMKMLQLGENPLTKLIT